MSKIDRVYKIWKEMMKKTRKALLPLIDDSKPIGSSAENNGLDLSHEFLKRMEIIEGRISSMFSMISDFQKVMIEQETYINKIRLDHEIIRIKISKTNGMK